MNRQRPGLDRALTLCAQLQGRALLDAARPGPYTADETPVTDHAFFYGTLMAGFDRRRRAGIDGKMTFRGRGFINGALFDLGIYPAAVPSSDGRIWGEVYEF